MDVVYGIRQALFHRVAPTLCCRGKGEGKRGRVSWQLLHEPIGDAVEHEWPAYWLRLRRKYIQKKWWRGCRKRSRSTFSCNEAEQEGLWKGLGWKRNMFRLTLIYIHWSQMSFSFFVCLIGHQSVHFGADRIWLDLDMECVCVCMYPSFLIITHASANTSPMHLKQDPIHIVDRWNKSERTDEWINDCLFRQWSR